MQVQVTHMGVLQQVFPMLGDLLPDGVQLATAAAADLHEAIVMRGAVDGAVCVDAEGVLTSFEAVQG